MGLTSEQMPFRDYVHHVNAAQRHAGAPSWDTNLLVCANALSSPTQSGCICAVPDVGDRCLLWRHKPSSDTQKTTNSLRRHWRRSGSIGSRTEYQNQRPVSRSKLHMDT